MMMRADAKPVLKLSARRPRVCLPLRPLAFGTLCGIPCYTQNERQRALPRVASR